MKIKDIQNSPNPRSLIFIVDQSLTNPSQLVRKDGDKHPLSIQIMDLDFVEDAFIQGQWVSVRYTTIKQKENRELMKVIAEILRNYEVPDLDPITMDEDIEDPQLILIQAVLEAEILPYLHSHGGSIELVGREENQVFIRYMGACGGCPASSSGTLQAIENILRIEIDPSLKIVEV